MSGWVVEAEPEIPVTVQWLQKLNCLKCLYFLGPQGGGSNLLKHKNLKKNSTSYYNYYHNRQKVIRYRSVQ